jgi:outer membrane beta-barrel protein
VAATLALPAVAEEEAAEAKPAEAKPAEAAPAADGGAFQRIDEREPRPGTPLIANKLYPMGGRFEFSGMFDISYADKYTDHLGGHGAVGFHVFDWLAFEGFGGYLVGDDTGIVDNVRRTDGGGGKSAGLATCFGDVTGPCEPQLPDLWQTTWFAGASAQWAPIYGKLSAVSEYDLNFQLYAKLGGGAEGIQRFLNNGGYGEAQVRPSGHYGLGLRLIPWKFVAIRAELTNYLGLNPNVEEHDANDEASCPDGYVITSGNSENCQPDISSSSMFQVGVSFLL